MQREIMLFIASSNDVKSQPLTDLKCKPKITRKCQYTHMLTYLIEFFHFRNYVEKFNELFYLNLFYYSSKKWLNLVIFLDRRCYWGLNKIDRQSFSLFDIYSKFYSPPTSISETKSEHGVTHESPTKQINCAYKGWPPFFTATILKFIENCFLSLS